MRIVLITSVSGWLLLAPIGTVSAQTAPAREATAARKAPAEPTPAQVDTIRRGIQLHDEGHYDEAIALYQQVGFEQLTARQNDYGPGQHALILKLYDVQGWPDRMATMRGDV